MWLLDKMLKKLIKKGELIVTDHDGKDYHYGAPDPNHGPVHRAADRQGRRLAHRQGSAHRRRRGLYGRPAGHRAAARHPRPRPARPLQRAVREAGRAASRRARYPQASTMLGGKLDQVNWKSRSRRNAEHTYNLTRRLYELFLDEDRQYTWPITATPANSLEQAQLDKKAHIAAKLNLKPGHEGARHRLRLGRARAVSPPPLRLSTCSASRSRPTRSPSATSAPRPKWRRRPGQVRADGLSRRRRPVRPDHQRRPDRASRHAALSGLLRARPHELLKPDGVMFSHCCGRDGRAGHHRRMDAQVHLPRRLYPGPVGAGQPRAEKHRLHRHRRRGDALPLRAHARGMV